MTTFENIRNIRIEQDSPRRYICTLDLITPNEAPETVEYCADGVDQFGICPQVFQAIEAIEDKSSFVSELEYKKSIQQEMFNNHNERMNFERKRRFTKETDHLNLKWQETQNESDRLTWINAKEAIRQELKYLEEMTLEEKQAMYPLLDAELVE